MPLILIKMFILSFYSSSRLLIFMLYYFKIICRLQKSTLQSYFSQFCKCSPRVYIYGSRNYGLYISLGVHNIDRSKFKYYILHCMKKKKNAVLIKVKSFFPLILKSQIKEMWPLNECVFYVQIQAAKPVYSDCSLDKLW